MRRYIAALLLILAVASNAIAGRVVEGVVKRVYDGDTVVLNTRENSKLKVRLYGIDAPETRKPNKGGQPYGDEATRVLADKILKRRVTVEIMDVDQYKRSVAIIRYGGRDINHEMVIEGMAWAYRQYLHTPYTSEYIEAENLARSRRIGLWRDSNPQPPWEFRHGRKDRRKHSRVW